MNDKRERGLALISEMMGSEIASHFETTAQEGGFASDSAEMALEFVFGAVWARPGLERKQRSLITLSILVATGQIAEFKNHVKIAVANGCSVVELQEMLIQTIPYLGFPKFASAHAAAIETLREIGLDTDTRTPEDRGML